MSPQHHSFMLGKSELIPIKMLSKMNKVIIIPLFILCSVAFTSYFTPVSRSLNFHYNTEKQQNGDQL